MMLRQALKIYGVFCFLFSFHVKASVPDIVNFTTKDYLSHSINYSFIQDSSGVLYIANAYCVLEYDGSKFRKIPLVNGKSAISLIKDAKGTIYVGSSSEFGYLTKDSTEKTVYISLKHLIPGDQEFNEIFHLVIYKNAIYFSTLHGIYRYSNSKIEQVSGIPKDVLLYRLKVVNNELIYSSSAGLGKVTDLKAELFSLLPSEYSAESIEWINNDYVLMGKFGIRSLRSSTLLNTILQKELHLAQISCSIQINKEEYLLGSVKNGLYLINTKGEILRHFTTEHGLQDNFIRNLFKDDSGNIWIAYNNGIGILKWNSPLRYITSSQKIEGMGYSGVVYNNTLYVATSHGVYYLKDWENGLNGIKSFELLEGLPSGSVNELKVANGALIICQNAETYSYSNGKLKIISNGNWYGSWVWTMAKEYDKNEAFVGNYIGISRYAFENGDWHLKADVKGFNESSRVLEIDKQGVVWVIQGNKGLYRVELNEKRDSAISVMNYAEKLSLSPDYFNDIFYLGDTIYITTYGGVYFLKGDSLIKDQSFSGVKKYVERARKFDDHSIYGIYKDKPHVLKKQDGKWVIQNTPVSFMRSNLLGSAEFFYKISPYKYLLGTQEGFAIYETDKNEEPKKLNCLIRAVELIGDSADFVLYNGKPKSAIKLPYSNNNLRFTFTIPAYGVMDQIVYETKLLRGKNAMHNWQTVKESNFREFTNLREGVYTILVRAKKGEYVLGEDQYSFIVQPPWYRTTLANILYIIILLVFGYLIKVKFDQQATKLKEEKLRELEIKEKLHNAEKLEIDLKNKENELAYMALSYTQKKELLASLVQKLDSLSKEISHLEMQKINDLKSSISSNMDDESNWENFQVHFDQKNDNFFQKIKEKDSNINESYLLFCSYVKMGKSNKEIADLMNISVAAVEKRKYRLKKKWDLADDVSFTDYLKSL